LDLLLGTWNDGVLRYRNDGTRQTPRWVQDAAATIELTRGSNTTPALADIDDDGDLDLFIGEAGGELNFYRNTGSASEPRFELVSDTFGSIDAGRRSAPAFADLDGDGDLDLVLGGEAGGAVHYRNDGTRTEPRFVRADDAFDVELPPYGVPRFVDIDGDGALDILAGGLSGGVVFWRGR
ncbi:MAG: FG-GAP-like repeat-containing protein, partial [Longimicrobiales bacterium]